MNVLDRKLTILIGHYGSGKTTIAVNLARNARQNSTEKISLADIDVNNPYFRSRDYLEQFYRNDIDLIIPDLEIAFAEMPYLPKRLYSALKEEQQLIIDVGGLDVGTKVLGSLAEQITKHSYHLWFVVNTYRPGTETAEEIIEMYSALQTLSKLSISGIIHNSNLAEFTRADDVILREKEIKLAAEKLGVTNVWNGIDRSLLQQVDGKLHFPTISIDRLSNIIW